MILISRPLYKAIFTERKFTIWQSMVG